MRPTIVRSAVAMLLQTTLMASVHKAMPHTAASRPCTDEGPGHLRRNPHWPAGGRQAAQEPGTADADAASPAAGSVDASPAEGSNPAASLADASGVGRGGAEGEDPVAEMVAHFRSIQGLFVADDPQNKQQAEALARHLRTAVDVQSLKARLQCAAAPAPEPCEPHCVCGVSELMRLHAGPAVRRDIRWNASGTPMSDVLEHTDCLPHCRNPHS